MGIAIPKGVLQKMDLIVLLQSAESVTHAKKCHEPINRHTLPSARAVVLIEASPNVISGNVTDCAVFQSLRIAYAKHGVTRPADGWGPKNSLKMSADDDLEVL